MPTKVTAPSGPAATTSTDVAPSPNWARAMPGGPDARVKIIESYARLVARTAYFWGWPMVNIYNRRLAFDKCPQPGLMNGVLPFAPLNTLSMLHDYVAPDQRWVACPNQDVVYGAGIAALERSPVVVQVPDFAGRFWVYQQEGRADREPSLKKAMADEAAKVEADVIAPLLQFRNWGLPLANHWSKVANPASFGTDYFARTAIAHSNILVNAPAETTYLYQDLDAAGERLSGTHRYTVTFAKDSTPPAYGFWSLTLYDAHHFFVSNDIRRFSLGTKNKGLQTNADGSLTIYVQADPPPDAQRSNWLPAPKGGDFSLYLRAYWPKSAVIDGAWAPPAVEKQP